MKHTLYRKYMMSCSLLLFAACGSAQQLASNASGDSPSELQQVTQTGAGATKASCDVLTSDGAAFAAFDFGDAKKQAMYDTLNAVDAGHSASLFLRASDDMLLWLTDDELRDPGALPTAIHEANHMLNQYLTECDADARSTYYFMGDVHTTGLKWLETEHYHIVEETIADTLKSAPRYQLYIEGLKAFNNDFSVLIDELTAYIGGGVIQEKFINSSHVPALEGNTTSKSYGGGADGTVNFMVFVQYYLKSARLNHPTTYARIQDAATLEYVQVLWTAAEAMLADTYLLTTDNRPGPYGLKVDIDYLRAAYSDDLLGELDRLGIRHLEASAWNSSYFL
jgi:hypothetical protein